MHAAEAVSVVPPLPDGDGGVTDRATRGACSAGSGTGLVHYLTGPEITETAPVTVSGLRGVEPLRETKTTLSCAALRFDTGIKRGTAGDGPLRGAVTVVLFPRRDSNPGLTGESRGS